MEDRPKDGATETERAAFFEGELLRRSQIWQEREQALLNEIDMRDAELNALEHRIKKGTLDMQDLEERLAKALQSNDQQGSREVLTKSTASDGELTRLRARAQRAEEQVLRLGEMLASVCRQESQLVALYMAARDQLRSFGCDIDSDVIFPMTFQSLDTTSSMQALKCSSAIDKPLKNSPMVNQASCQASAFAVREQLHHASREATALENEMRKLQVGQRGPPSPCRAVQRGILVTDAKLNALP